MRYADLALAEPLKRAVAEMGYESMTPIQAQAIPVVITGKDVMGAAQTGTGKTAAFSLPLLHRLMKHENASTSPARHPVRALVLLPTRELADLPLVTAGSGVAIALPGNFGLQPSAQASALPPASGLRAIVSGSCSQATNAQVAHFIAGGGVAHVLDPLRLARDRAGAVAEALALAEAQLPSGPVLIYSTAEPMAVAAVQAQLGTEGAGALVEQALAEVAQGLLRLGVRQLVVAGGETSGAVVQALGVRQMQIGPQIDPGVPWCHAFGNDGPLHLALKSGNFGSDDFFTKAFAQLA